MSRPTALADLLARLEASPVGDDTPDLGGLAWLAQVVTALFDGQEPAAAHDWAARVHADLVRLDGRVPFAVVHDWHAETVAPLLDEVCEGQAAVGALHARALAGSPVAQPQWTAALEPALRDVYRRAYAYDDAYRVNYDSAHVYGTANGFGEEGTREYATYYAELATGANLRAYADANAIANARACATAFAAADPVRYAESYPYAAARAYALALANADGACDRSGRDRTAHAQLAEERPADLSGRDRMAHAHLAEERAADQSGRGRTAHARLAEGLAASLGRAASGHPRNAD